MLGDEPIIRIIPKPKAEMPKIARFLFWFSLVLLIILLSFFVLLKNQKLNEERRLSEIKNEIANIQLKPGLEEELIISSQKIRDFIKILERHTFPSKLFDFLKSVCHPKVQLTAFQFDNNENEVTLSGKAKDFRSLAEQIFILKKNSKITKLQVTNVFLNREGDVEFNLNFNFVKELLKE